VNLKSQGSQHGPVRRGLSSLNIERSRCELVSQKNPFRQSGPARRTIRLAWA
jgi:hypothetical protein